MQNSAPAPAIPPAGPQTMSKTTRNIIIGVLLFLVLVCLGACAAFLIAGRSLGNVLSRSTTEDPAQLASMAAEIADFTPARGFSPKAGFNLLGFNMVMYGTSDEQAMMMLIQMPTTTEITPADIEQMRDAAESQSGRSTANYTVIDEYETTIRGKPAQVIIQEGTTDQNERIRVMLVAFQGKGGTAMMMVMAPPNRYDQAAYDKMMKSIR